MAGDPALGPGDIVASGLCIGCGACTALPELEARMGWDRHGQFKPAVAGRPAARDFARLCPFSPQALNEDEIAAGRFPAARPHPLIGRHEAAYVGHVAEPGFRENGSSGGMVSWVAAELLRLGLVDGVAHVAEAGGTSSDGRLFGYRLSRTLQEVRAGAKSRYYPVELSGVLAQMRATPGRYAVVGVPCFIKAVHLLRAADPVLNARIAHTLGLYCGHMKSRHLAESFAWQMGTGMDEVERLDFRAKDARRPANWYRARLSLRGGGTRERDWWHLVDGDWGAGFFQNAACDFCDDVVAETADIAFGDAWVEPYASDGRGTNVIVVRDPALHRLLRAGMAEDRLSLRPVDADFVVRTQAAGFRQRREGLAYRLGWRRAGLRPRKRVAPGTPGLGLRRRLIYRMRHRIARNSHKVFRLARLLAMPILFMAWARAMGAIYGGLAYSRGPLGRLADLLERRFGRPPPAGRPVRNGERPRPR